MGTAIHPTAVVDSSAELADDVEVGPYAIIEAGAKIGPGSRIMAHAVVGRNTVLGEENSLHFGAVVGHRPQDISTTGEEDARVIAGDRNTFREYCTVHRGSRDGSNTTIGNDCFVMAQSHIAHDCILGDRIILASGSLLAGHIHVEDKAFISGNVAVHQFCRIGELAMISGLSRVHKDVPPFFMLMGDSQIRGLNHVGLHRAGYTEEQRLDIRKAYKLIYRRNLRLPNALAKIETTLGHSPHALHIVKFVRESQRGISPHHRRGAPRA